MFQIEDTSIPDTAVELRHKETVKIFVRPSSKREIDKNEGAVKRPKTGVKLKPLDQVENSGLFINLQKKPVLKTVKDMALIYVAPNQSWGGFRFDSIDFQLYGKQLFFCKKVSRVFCSKFIISEDNEKMREFVLQSNFSGTRYNFIGVDQKQILMTICYEGPALCNIHQTRRVQIYILDSETAFENLQMKDGAKKDLEELFKIGMNCQKIKKYCNKTPIFDPQNQTWSLKFNQSQLRKSVHNTIIIDNNQKQAIKFFEIGYESYAMRISKQFPKEYAYAYALSSLDFKLICE